MSRINWAGAAVFVLAAGLGIGWGTTLIAAVFAHTSFTPAGLNVLTAIGSGMIGIVAAYVGAHIRWPKRNGKDDDT